MPVVAGYTVVHTIGGRSELSLRFENGTQVPVTNLSIAEAGYLIDLLRNEKPINFNPATRVLSLGSIEPVGERE